MNTNLLSVTSNLNFYGCLNLTLSQQYSYKEKGMFQMEFIDISLILYKFICIILCFPNLVRKINGESNSKHIVAFSIQFVACFLALKFWNVKVKKKPC